MFQKWSVFYVTKRKQFAVSNSSFVYLRHLLHYYHICDQFWCVWMLKPCIVSPFQMVKRTQSGWCGIILWKGQCSLSILLHLLRNLYLSFIFVGIFQVLYLRFVSLGGCMLAFSYSLHLRCIQKHRLDLTLVTITKVGCPGATAISNVVLCCWLHGTSMGTM